jgi:6-pyruvoyltetrahydropterin/6-carboxytetrahydropterin synthase
MVCGKRYVFPKEEVVLLPIENVTTECLSAYLANQLEKQLPSSIRSLTVGVEESLGQGAEFTVERG